MIDNVIMEAVFKDEKALGRTSTRPNYLLMTGQWRMVDDDEGVPHILSTDNFRRPEDVLDVIVAPDCEVVDGELLIMYTSVLLDDMDFSLVLLKGKVYGGPADEADVG